MKIWALLLSSMNVKRRRDIVLIDHYCLCNLKILSLDLEICAGSTALLDFFRLRVFYPVNLALSHGLQRINVR